MMKLWGAAVAVGCGLLVLGAPAARAEMHVVQGQYYGESAAVRDLPLSRRDAVRQVMPLRHPRAVENRRQPAVADPVVQTLTAPSAAVSKGPNFDGLGVGFPNSTICCDPPDTNAAVGSTQVVETVNLSYAVFDKRLGTTLAGPIDLSALFGGIGNNCETGFQSDPVVQFDKNNGRWVITYLAATPGGLIGAKKPFLQCFAVSTTNDATGSYFVYAFDVTSLGGGSAGALNDYGKLAVWPDAYYMGFNEFSASTGLSLGAEACAFQSAAMVIAFPPQMVCSGLLPSEDTLLPAGYDGAQPPAGEPAFYVGTLNGSNAFNLWKFHVDFATPGNSTFTGPTTLTTAPYAEACGGGTCIPQPAGGAQLDSLADRLMFRPGYRNLGSHELIVVSHSVTAGSSTGIRWYEIRNPNGTPSIFQQGTYAPDSRFRWMPAIAMDKVGNIGVGYSVSSTSLDPSIRVAGRTPAMPPGKLSAEINVVTGSGVQTGGIPRWGDYSSMSIDPIDDCTFWYAQEYIKTSGDFSWSTRLASFKLNSCH